MIVNCRGTGTAMPRSAYLIYLKYTVSAVYRELVLERRGGKILSPYFYHDFTSLFSLIASSLNREAS
ncbi:hypothetical protein NIES22_37850 [Calothrix brevissima NIES-22]|nr:hypothetical protein NIES22_37850 [Calothrix brevissima NIES-22]